MTNQTSLDIGIAKIASLEKAKPSMTKRQNASGVLVKDGRVAKRPILGGFCLFIGGEDKGIENHGNKNIVKGFSILVMNERGIAL